MPLLDGRPHGIGNFWENSIHSHYLHKHVPLGHIAGANGAEFGAYIKNWALHQVPSAPYHLFMVQNPEQAIYDYEALPAEDKPAFAQFVSDFYRLFCENLVGGGFDMIVFDLEIELTPERIEFAYDKMFRHVPEVLGVPYTNFEWNSLYAGLPSLPNQISNVVAYAYEPDQSLDAYAILKRKIERFTLERANIGNSAPIIGWVGSSKVAAPFFTSVWFQALNAHVITLTGGTTLIFDQGVWTSPTFLDSERECLSDWDLVVNAWRRAFGTRAWTQFVGIVQTDTYVATACLFADGEVGITVTWAGTPAPLTITGLTPTPVAVNLPDPCGKTSFTMVPRSLRYEDNDVSWRWPT